MEDSFRIRPASLADLDRLVLLERASFSDPWTIDQLADTILQPSTLGLIAEAGEGEIAGYLLGRIVADEAEVLTLAVCEASRRHGLGKRLLGEALAGMASRGVRAVWLEVRHSNAAAQALYLGAGFVATGVRRGYYRRPVEDAIVLRRDLDPGAFAGPSLR
jgi:ribosomal-protein-alanine N-acetyltransferase